MYRDSSSCQRGQALFVVFSSDWFMLNNINITQLHYGSFATIQFGWEMDTSAIVVVHKGVIHGPRLVLSELYMESSIEMHISHKGHITKSIMNSLDLWAHWHLSELKVVHTGHPIKHVSLTSHLTLNVCIQQRYMSLILKFCRLFLPSYCWSKSW